MEVEVLRVWKGKINHADYVSHCLVLVTDASYLKLSEYIKDDSEKGGKRYNRAELFSVRTCKMECSIWLTKDRTAMLKSPLDLDRQSSQQIVLLAKDLLAMQEGESF